MKTISMSYDVAEWTRYYIEVEVDETLSVEEQREQIIDKISEGDYQDCGTKSLGNVEMLDVEYNFPDELGGPT